MDAAEGSPAALRGELAEHRAQLQELAQLAAAGDEEAAAALADVREVIELTEVGVWGVLGGDRRGERARAQGQLGSERRQLGCCSRSLRLCTRSWNLA